MKKRSKQKFEQAATIAAVVYPLAAIPQAIQLFSNKDASGLSLFAWVAFFLVELVLFAYGIVFRLQPIIITGVLWSVLYVVIIVGIILYG